MTSATGTSKKEKTRVPHGGPLTRLEHRGATPHFTPFGGNAGELLDGEDGENRLPKRQESMESLVADNGFKSSLAKGPADWPAISLGFLHNHGALVGAPDGVVLTRVSTEVMPPEKDANSSLGIANETPEDIPGHDLFW